MGNPKYPVVSAADLLDNFLGIIRTAVVHEDNLVIDVQLLEYLNQALVHDRYGLAVLVTRNHRRDALIWIALVAFGMPVVKCLVWQRPVPIDSALQAIRDGGPSAPAKQFVGARRVGAPEAGGALGPPSGMACN